MWTSISKVDNSEPRQLLHSGRFTDFRSCWVVFIHIVQGRPGGLLQFSKGEAVNICLASDSSGIRATWPNRERHRAWTVAKRCGCSVFHLTSSFCTLNTMASEISQLLMYNKHTKQCDYLMDTNITSITENHLVAIFTIRLQTQHQTCSQAFRD